MCTFYSGPQVVAAITSRTGQPSIHHSDCEVLVDHGKLTGRCHPCSWHRNSLRAMVARVRSKDMRTHPSSHTNYSAISTPDKDERLRRLHSEAKSCKRRVDRLKERICVAATAAKANVDESLDADLRVMTTECTDLVTSTYPKGSFQCLFGSNSRKLLHLTTRAL